MPDTLTTSSCCDDALYASRFLQMKYRPLLPSIPFIKMFLFANRNYIRGVVRPSVGPLVGPSVRWSVGRSVTFFFGGQKQRLRTTYFVYTNLFNFPLI